MPARGERYLIEIFREQGLEDAYETAKTSNMQDARGLFIHEVAKDLQMLAVRVTDRGRTPNVKYHWKRAGTLFPRVDEKDFNYERPEETPTDTDK